MASNKKERESFSFSVLPLEEIERINTASLRILKHTGLFVDSSEGRKKLAEAGAKIKNKIAYIPETLVEKSLASASPTVTVYSRDGEPFLHLGSGRSYYHGVTDHQYILDPFLGKRRKFTSADYGMTAKVIDACENLAGAHSVGNVSDYPPAIQSQIAFKNSMLNMKKPFVCAVHNVEELSIIYEMATVIAGDKKTLEEKPFIFGSAQPISPLTFPQDAIDKLSFCGKYNIPIVWYCAINAGTTGPCSASSLLALANAEVLAGLVLHQLENPGAPFIYGAMPTMTDMKSMLMSYGSPDFALLLAAATSIAHNYGLPMYGTAGCSDSLSVDEQAAVEATILCQFAQFSKADLVHDVGLLAGNTLIAPEMIVLCNEILEMVKHSTTKIKTESIDIDTINRIGPQGNYLTTQDTYKNFNNFWYSDIFPRKKLPQDDLLDKPQETRERIRCKTQSIIENYEPVPLAQEVAKELDEIEHRLMKSFPDFSLS